ncbi:hypothetical protein MG293_009091 [Ovis ammon polii]|uniref:Uncharacterized protein n=1 Tax=Ovis ammon polii TaxID=230172 RepID=A0AAD4UAK3_OVIAM|nr:hypothetical protein MG293_009091 [Ovis ammon polii]
MSKANLVKQSSGEKSCGASDDARGTEIQETENGILGVANCDQLLKHLMPLKQPCVPSTESALLLFYAEEYIFIFYFGAKLIKSSIAPIPFPFVGLEAVIGVLGHQVLLERLPVGYQQPL